MGGVRKTKAKCCKICNTLLHYRESGIYCKLHKPIKKCLTCGAKLSRKAIGEYCNHHRDRSGENNSFFGKQHTKETIAIIKLKCGAKSKLLWTNKLYRDKVISRASKPRSLSGKKNISIGVKLSYDKISGLRDYRGIAMKNTWSCGRMNKSNYNINKSKALYDICEYIQQAFPRIGVYVKHAIKYIEDSRVK